MAKRSRTDYIAVHCSATPPGMNIGADEIDRWHKQRGWSGIGYHIVIRRDGTAEMGRPMHKRGAHVKSYNDVSVGVCLIGGVDEGQTPQNNFTNAQFDRLEDELRKLKATYPNARIQGHRDFPGVAKACPSFQVSDWLADRGMWPQPEPVAPPQTME